MMNKRIILSAITMCLVSMSALASLPSHNPVFVDQLNDTFTGDGYQASVTSTVYELGPTAGGYLYTYQISGATTPFTWFSIALDPAVSIIASDSDGIVNTPWFFAPVGSYADPTSIEAYFNPGLTSGTSALLWFTSSFAPDINPGIGALAKLSGVGGAYVEGNVLVPIPEPITAALLGLGMLAVRSFKRK